MEIKITLNASLVERLVKEHLEEKFNKRLKILSLIKDRGSQREPSVGYFVRIKLED